MAPELLHVLLEEARERLRSVPAATWQNVARLYGTAKSRGLASCRCPGNTRFLCHRVQERVMSGPDRARWSR